MTYKILDLQTDEMVASNQTLNDLIAFVHDLFWQDDDVDVTSANIQVVSNFLEGCDYLLQHENE